MINAGFNPLQTMSEKTGKSVAQLKKEMSAGAISAEMVQQAFIDATSEGGKFYKMSEKGAQTIQGQMSMLSDATDSMFNELGKSSEGIIMSLIKGAQWVVQHYEAIGKILVTIAATYGTYKAVLAATTMWEKLKAAATREAEAATTQSAAANAAAAASSNALNASEARGVTIKQMAAVAQKKLNDTILLHPYALITAAVVGLGVAIYQLITAESDAERRQRALNEEMERGKKNIDDYMSKVNALVNTIKSSDSTELQKQLAFDELKERAPQIVEVYDTMEKIAAIDPKDMNKFSDEKEEQALQKRRKELKALLEQLKGANKFSPFGRSDIALVKAKALAESVGFDFSSWDSAEDMITEVEGALGGITNRLVAIHKAQDEISEPKEIKIQLAEAEAAKAKEELDTIDKFGVALKEDLEQPIMINGVDRTTPILDDLDAKINALKDEQINSPITFNADKQKTLDDLSNLRTSLERWRDECKRDGVFRLVFDVIARMNWLNTKKKTPTDGDATPEPTSTNAEDLKQKKAEYDKATKAYNDFLRDNKKKYTESQRRTERDNLKKAMDTAKAAYVDAGGNPNASKSAAKKGISEAQKAADKKAQAELAARKREIAIAKEEENAKLKMEQDALANDADGYAKEQKQIDLQYKQRMQSANELSEKYIEELRKQKVAEYEAAHPKATTEAKANYEMSLLSDGEKEVKQSDLLGWQVDAIKSAIDEAARYREKAQKALKDKHAKDLDDMLKEFGTYEEQRAAIERTYQREMDNATSLSAQMQATQKHDAALKEVAKQERDDVNWEAIFTNLDAYSLEYLQTIKGNLKDAFKDPAITADVASELGKRLDEVNTKIRERKSEWKSVFGIAIPELERQKQLEDEANTAQEEAISAQSVHLSKLDEEKEIRKEILALYQQMTDESLDTLDPTKAEEYMKAISDKKGGEAAKSFGGMLTSWLSKRDEANKAGKAASQAKKNATDKEAMAKHGGGLTSTLGATSAIMHGVNDNLQSMGEFIDKLGVGETEAGKRLKTFAESSQYATQAFDSLKNGDIIGAVSSIGSAFESLGEVFGIFGDSDKTYHEDMERLARTNEALQSAIDNLAEKMDEASVSEAFEIYETQKENLDKYAANLQENLQRGGAASRRGIFKGAHSTNHEIDNGMSDADWDAIEKAVGGGVTIRQATDLWNLTSEQMARIAEKDATAWAHLLELADDGKEDITEVMKEYITLYKQIDEIETALNENVTGTSFDTLSSNFMNAIMDMEATANDFADDFESLMKTAVFNSLMRDTYNNQLKSWYDKFSSYMDEGLNEKEQNALKEEYQNIVSGAMKKRDEFYKMLGWDTSTSQSAASAAVTSVSEDTAGLIVGRMTAINESQMRQEQNAVMFSVNLQTLSDTALGVRNIASGIRDSIERSYLELQQISENTGAIIAPIRQIQSDIAKVKSNTEKL